MAIMKTLSFPRLVSLIDADILMFDVTVKSLKDLEEEINISKQVNPERKDVYGTDDEFDYVFIDGKLTAREGQKDVVYKVSFNLPNGDSYSVLETTDLTEAIEKYNRTSALEADGDPNDIEVELKKFVDGEITPFKGELGLPLNEWVVKSEIFEKNPDTLNWEKVGENY